MVLIKNSEQKSKYLIVDSSALKVCEKHKVKKHKTFLKTASQSYTSTGEFYGFKIHLLINDLNTESTLILTEIVK